MIVVGGAVQPPQSSPARILGAWVGAWVSSVQKQFFLQMHLDPPGIEVYSACFPFAPGSFLHTSAICSRTERVSIPERVGIRVGDIPRSIILGILQAQVLHAYVWLHIVQLECRLLRSYDRRRRSSAALPVKLGEGSRRIFWVSRQLPSLDANACLLADALRFVAPIVLKRVARHLVRECVLVE